MTKAVAEAGVTVITKIAVNIVHPLRRQLVYPCCVLHPLNVEVLPEGGGTHVEHPAPVVADDLQRLILHTGQREGIEHVEAIEGGEAFGTIYCHHLPAGSDRIQDPGYRHQGSCL